MEKHELDKIDFELIDDAFKALLKSNPDLAVADKVADLRDKFRDAFTGWLENRTGRVMVATIVTVVVTTRCWSPDLHSPRTCTYTRQQCEEIVRLRHTGICSWSSELVDATR